MELIYVCCPYSGQEENYIKALNYCRYVKSKGKVPICPVTMYHGVYDDRIPEERATAKKAGQELLKLCDEVWVFGARDGATMKAKTGSGKPIHYIKDDFRFNDLSETLSVLINIFQNKTGRLINRMIMENMVFYLNEGLSDKLITAAIEKAALKSAGWEYVEGILKNCLSKGIKTAEDFENDSRTIKPEGDFGAFDLDMYEQMLRNRDY